MSGNGWIGVDWDGTLVEYDSWKGPTHHGKPIPRMVERVKAWLDAGEEVRIFTARVHGDEAQVARASIMDKCQELFGQPLRVTNIKDYAMRELWDDRAVQVIPNTGKTIADELEALKAAHAGAP